MTRRSRTRASLVVAAAVLTSIAATATAYSINGSGNVVDSLGREWRDPAEVLNFTWDQIDAACHHEGEVGERVACSGSATGAPNGAGTVDLTGWTWAFAGEVCALFIGVVNQNGGALAGCPPELREVDSVWAGPAVLALGKTSQDVSLFFELTQGWSATRVPGIGAEGIVLQVIDSTFPANVGEQDSVTTLLLPTGSSGRTLGGWFYRSAAPLPPGPAAAIPTLSEWGMRVLPLLMSGLAWSGYRMRGLGQR